VKFGQLAELVGEGGKQINVLKTVRFAENKIVKNVAFETGVAVNKNGNVILRKKGTENAIDFTNAEVKKMTGKTQMFTHNHPGGTSLSGTDVNAMMEMAIPEVRAVTDDFVFRMKYHAPATAVEQESFKKTIKNKLRRLESVERQKMYAKNLKWDDMLKESKNIPHKVNKALAGKYPERFTYIKEGRVIGS